MDFQQVGYGQLILTLWIASWHHLQYLSMNCLMGRWVLAILQAPLDRDELLGGKCGTVSHRRELRRRMSKNILLFKTCGSSLHE
jgi:hypothetical protein